MLKYKIGLILLVMVAAGCCASNDRPQHPSGPTSFESVEIGVQHPLGGYVIRDLAGRNLTQLSLVKCHRGSVNTGYGGEIEVSFACTHSLPAGRYRLEMLHVPGHTVGPDREFNIPGLIHSVIMYRYRPQAAD